MFTHPRRTLVLAAAALVSVIGISAQAGAAVAPAYKVTLRTGVASSTADHFITVAGRVTGPRAVGRPVTIQRHYVGGPWVSVTTAVVRANGTYKARVETPRGGTTSFRAIKPRSAVRRAGASAARSIPVYKWLYVSDQPAESGYMIHGVDETIAGKHYPHSVEFFVDSFIELKFAKQCKQFTTIAAYLPQSPGAPAADATFVTGTFGSGVSSTPVSTTVNAGTPVVMKLSEVGTQFRYINVNNTEAGYRAVLGDPKVYCNADVLPTWAQSEID